MPAFLSLVISAPSSVRIVVPMALPSMRLAGNAYRPGLPNHDHLDLPWVLELAFDLARNLVGHPGRRGVIDSLRRHDDAHLAARLDREHLFDALELRGELLEIAEPLDVGLERLAPRAGARSRDRVRGLHDDAHRGFVRHVVVMRGDAVNDRRILAVLGRHLDAELDVGAVVLVGQHFADVVEQRPTLRETDVELQLGGHHTGEVGDFLRMLEDVLAVRGAVLHPPDQLHQLGVHAANAGVVHGLLARLDDARVHVGLRLLHDLFDAARMDAAVGDQPLERQAADLAAHRLEAGHDDRIGRVVDDDVDAGGGLERANVAALAPDDAALHFVGRQQHGRHARLGRLLGGDPLDRERDDLLRFAIGVLLGLLGDVAHQGRRFVARLGLEAGDELELGFLGGQSGHLFEARTDPLFTLVETARTLLELLLGFVEIRLAAVDAGELLVEALMEVLAYRHELFFGREDEALAGVGRTALDAPAPDVEDHRC